LGFVLCLELCLVEVSRGKDRVEGSCNI
jgi:hypothetical protein